MLSRPGVDSVSVVSCPNVGYKVKTWLKEKSPEMKIHYNSSKVNPQAVVNEFTSSSRDWLTDSVPGGYIPTLTWTLNG